jgi:hypothetical protein
MQIGRNEAQVLVAHPGLVVGVGCAVPVVSVEGAAHSEPSA